MPVRAEPLDGVERRLLGEGAGDQRRAVRPLPGADREQDVLGSLGLLRGLGPVSQVLDQGLDLDQRTRRHLAQVARDPDGV